MNYFLKLTELCNLRLKLVNNGNINSESKLEKQPSNILLELKSHQKAMLHKMKYLENSCTKNIQKINDTNNLLYGYRMGVIGDKVGSGKSLTVLSIIAENTYFHNMYLEVESLSKLIKIKTQYPDSKYIRTNIIVVPHSIVKQWEGYIKNNTNLEYYVISRKSHFKKEVYSYNKIPIILISSSQYNYFADTYNPENIIFSRIFFDEADSLNIPNNRELPAFFYWFVTSSLRNLLFPSGYYYTFHSECKDTCYNSSEGFSKVYINGIKKKGFIKDIFKALEKNSNLECYLKNENQFIDNSFQIPEPKKSVIHCKLQAHYNVIQDVIGKDLLSMINAGDIEGVVNKLNMTQKNETSIIKMVSQKIVNTIENYQKKKEYLLSLHVESEKDRKSKIKKIEEKICSFYSRLNNIKDKINNFSNEICPICYDILEKPIAVTNCCQNLFCFNCLTKSMCLANQKCPMCREFLLSNQDFHLLENNIDTENTLPSKIEALDNLLAEKKKENAKILIFSSYNNTFNKIKTLITNNNLKYSRISGNMSCINNVLTKFQKGDINVLLLNSRYYGTGMNITEATDIIIYHKMKKELELQVIGRAQRMGRKNQLKIHYLYHSNEYK